LDSCAHGYAVGEHGADGGFVEDVGGVVGALLVAGSFTGRIELFECVGIERRIAVEVEDGLPCVVERG